MASRTKHIDPFPFFLRRSSPNRQAAGGRSPNEFGSYNGPGITPCESPKDSAPTMARVSPRVNRRKIRLLLFGNYVSVRPFGFMIDGIVVRLNLSQKFFAFGGLQRRF